MTSLNTAGVYRVRRTIGCGAVAAYRNDATIARLRQMFLMLLVIGLGGGALGLIRAASPGIGPAFWSGLMLTVNRVVFLFLRRRTGEMVVESEPEGVVAEPVHDAAVRVGRDRDDRRACRRRGITNAVVRTISGREHPLGAAGDPGTTSARIVKALRRDLHSARKR